MDTYLAPEDPDEDADPYGPDSPLAALAVLCERLGVTLPPLPAALIPLLEQIDETIFASRDDRESLMNEDEWIAEAVAGDAPFYVAFSNEGTGSNNWYLRYYVALPAVALFVVLPFGGAYMEPDVGIAQAAVAFDRAATLIERALAYAGPRRFVVVHRGVAGGEWCDAAEGWRQAIDPITAVSDLLA